MEDSKQAEQSRAKLVPAAGSAARNKERGRSSVATDRERNANSSDRSDQAALMGLVLVAFVALLLGEGRWDWLSMVLGLTLGCIVGGYYQFLI